MTFTSFSVTTRDGLGTAGDTAQIGPSEDLPGLFYVSTPAHFLWLTPNQMRELRNVITNLLNDTPIIPLQDEIKEFREGNSSFLLGFARDTNPYDFPSASRDHWHDGWDFMQGTGRIFQPRPKVVAIEVTDDPVEIPVTGHARQTFNGMGLAQVDGGLGVWSDPAAVPAEPEAAIQDQTLPSDLHKLEGEACFAVSEEISNGSEKLSWITKARYHQHMARYLRERGL